MNISRAARGLAAAAIAIATATSLSACDTFLADPIALTAVGDSKVVRTCIPLTVREVEIKTYAGEDDYEGTTVWRAVGSVYMPAGTELALGEPTEGFEVVLDDRVDYSIGDFAVELEVSSARGGDWRTFGRFTGSQFIEGTWLDGDGYVQDVPCTREECMKMSACHNEWPVPTGQPLELESTFTPRPTSSSGP